MNVSNAIASALAATMLAGAAAAAEAAENSNHTDATSNGVSAVLTATKTRVQLGDPIIVSLSVKNQGDHGAAVDRSATAFNCFEVLGPAGQSAPYVGFIGQAASTSVNVRPSSSTIIAEGLDLTDKYVFEKPGRYAIRFRGAAGVPASNAITVEVTPGRLGELDQLVLQLLPVRPRGWGVTRSPRSEHEVAPFGRAGVPGYSAHICRNYMQGEAVYLWFTKAEAPLAPEPKPRIMSQCQYLGRTIGLHVYIAEDKKVPTLWPKATEDISRALQIEKE